MAPFILVTVVISELVTNCSSTAQREIFLIGNTCKNVRTDQQWFCVLGIKLWVTLGQKNSQRTGGAILRTSTKHTGQGWLYLHPHTTAAFYIYDENGVE